MMEDLLADFERATSKLRVEEDVLELSKKIIDRCGVLSPEMLSSPQVGMVTAGQPCCLYIRCLDELYWQTLALSAERGR